MTKDVLTILKHQVADENPQDDFDALQEMTREQALAYLEAEGTITTEEILDLASQLR